MKNKKILVVSFIFFALLLFGTRNKTAQAIETCMSEYKQCVAAGGNKTDCANAHNQCVVDNGSDSCPANSTENQTTGECDCNSGYKENTDGDACVADPGANDDVAKAACEASGGTWENDVKTCKWITNPGSGNGTNGPKCGTSGDFEEISGVCFPKNTGLSGASVGTILNNLLYWLFAIFSILAIMAFVISGIQYLSSSTDEDLIETAKRNATWSLIGIIVGLSGFIILKAIDAALSGSAFF
jgi:hypothetical protein